MKDSSKEPNNAKILTFNGGSSITRRLLNSGTPRHYIDEFSVTGLTSIQTMVNHDGKSPRYDVSIRKRALRGKP